MKKLLNEWQGYLNESSFTRVKNKIDKGKIPFALVSAYREGGNNQTAHKSIKADLVSMGYSFTEVVGGGQEELKDEEGQPITDEEGKPKVTNVREMTLLVTPEKRGDSEASKFQFYQSLKGDPQARKDQSRQFFSQRTREETKKLFRDIQSLASKYEQFAFIFGYPREVKDSVTGDTTTDMFIAAYDSSAEAPGEAHRIKDAWAGPWSSIERAADDDIYYTKIAGTKGALVQEFIKSKINEIKSLKAKNQFDRMKKSYEVKRWQSLLN